MITLRFFLLLALSAAHITAPAAAHGFVREIVLGSISWPGYSPFVDSWWQPPPQRLVRKIPGIAPIEDLTLIDIQCNGNTEQGYFTEPAALVGTVAAGEIVQLNWLNHAGDNHKGPLLTYMARTPDDIDITEWQPGSEQIWFKVAHEGKSDDGKWASTEMFEQRNGTYAFRIPANLRAGQYLIRHEWIALHFADKYPGFQTYPVCIQVNVTGQGSAFPSSFVSFPGEYTPKSPGVIFDVWNDNGVSSTCPNFPSDGESLNMLLQPYPIPGPEM